MVRISKSNPSSFNKSVDFYVIEDARSLASANGLYYRLGWLFVADGLGGMKIVLVDQL
ncbi:hypothetical protein KKA14_18980 [bacterium]|nr:hypothetical protein [bacterium]